MYGKTIKPNLASSSVAFSVSMGSGKRYLGSGWISSLSQLVSRASLANCAAKMASFALRAPEVLGNKLILGCFKCAKIASVSVS